MTNMENDPLYMMLKLLNMPPDGSDDEPNYDEEDYSDGFQNGPFDMHLDDFISEDGDYCNV